jgi:branched-chain amino acid transport system substrate-binding protein
LAGVVFVTAGLLVACTGSHDAGPATTTLGFPTTSAVQRDNVDGQLRIGILLPSSGSGATIGQPMIKAVGMAVTEINKAGGVLGKDVILFSQDEGSTTITAAKAVDSLLASHVDAIIGPASSRIALSLIDRIKQSEVLTCSPSATAIALSDPSDDGYFIRTIPSDSLQASVLASQIIRTGYHSTTVVYPDDDYGTRFGASLRGYLEASAVTVTTQAYDPVNPADVTKAANAVMDEKPFTVAVLGDASAATMIAELKKVGVGSAETPVFVDDGMRHPDLASTSNVPADALEGVMGASPEVDPNPSAITPPVDWFRSRFAAYAPDTSMAFAAYAYDCTNLIALAASIAGTDDGNHMRQPAIDASRNGQTCRDYAECSSRLEEDRDIDLSGASGEINLNANGDPTRGFFDVFEIQGGRDVSLGTVLGTQ